MSVMMGLRITADPTRVEEALNSDPERLKEIAQRSRDAGCIHHKFFANEAGGEILVVDDAASFLRFFESSPDIGEMMGKAGVTYQPTPGVLARAWTRRTSSRQTLPSVKQAVTSCEVHRTGDRY